MIPPFHADQVGNLLCPAWLAHTRAQWKAGDIGDVTLKHHEDPKFTIKGRSEPPPIVWVTDEVVCRRRMAAVLAGPKGRVDALARAGAAPVAKMTTPSHSMLQLRGGRAAVTREAFPWQGLLGGRAVAQAGAGGRSGSGSLGRLLK